MDIPDWLYEAMGERAGAYYENDRGYGFSPNYTHRYLMERHQMAIGALGARYDGHPGVAFVELGSLGHDGSWTVEGVDGEWDMPPSNDLRSWVWAYTSAFDEIPLLASAPYQPVRLTGIGVYNDALGDEQATWDWLDMLEYGGYDNLSGAELRGMGDFYRWTPIGAHIADSIDQQALFGKDASRLVRALRESHTTYVSGVQATDLDPSMRYAQSLAQLTMGYRLWVREASWPCTLRAGYRLSTELVVNNDGSQAFSQPWPVELSLLRGDEVVYRQNTRLDVRRFETGSTSVSAQIELPTELPAGSFLLALAIIDPYDGQPAVDLAMDAPKVGLRSVLGDILVLTP